MKYVIFDVSKLDEQFIDEMIGLAEQLPEDDPLLPLFGGVREGLAEERHRRAGPAGAVPVVAIPFPVDQVAKALSLPRRRASGAVSGCSGPTSLRKPAARDAHTAVPRPMVPKAAP